MSITAFWNGFSAFSDLWSKEMESGNQRKVFDAIDSLLQSNSLPFCFDITNDDGGCLLIFSPEGDAEIARSIDQLVKSAPTSENWRILGRRPQKDLEDAAAIVRKLYLLDPVQLRYRARHDNMGPIVDMIVPTTADLSPEEAQGMINTFLWHVIGEGTVMNEHIRGNVIFDDKPDGTTISATQLVAIGRR
ncbi:MAG TPA: hypothetical protein VKV15_04600 [Bryobacteraceae bacterium]|nr:hypothetical protein [Bryobacteraceae bacterium]